MGFFDFLKPLAGAVPVVGGVLQGVLGGLAGSNANNAELASQQMWNDYLKNRGDTANMLVDRLTQSGYNPFGPQTSYGSNYGTTTSDQTTNFNNLMRKLVDPAQAAGKAALENQVFGRLGTAAVGEGEKVRAVKAINDAYQNAMQGALDTAGIRGGGPLAGLGASQGVAAQRASQIADYLGSQVPQLERQRQLENEQAANQLLNAWQGQQQSGTSTTHGLQNMFGGSSQTRGPDINALSNLFMPIAPNAPMQTGQSPWLQAGSDILGATLGWGQNQGWWGNKNQPVQQLPAAQNWTSQVFGQ